MFGTMMATITNTKRRMLKDETCDPGLRRDFLRDFLVTFLFFEKVSIFLMSQIMSQFRWICVWRQLKDFEVFFKGKSWKNSSVVLPGSKSVI